MASKLQIQQPSPSPSNGNSGNNGNISSNNLVSEKSTRMAATEKNLKTLYDAMKKSRRSKFDQSNAVKSLALAVEALDLEKEHRILHKNVKRIAQALNDQAINDKTTVVFFFFSFLSLFSLHS